VTRRRRGWDAENETKTENQELAESKKEQPYVEETKSSRPRRAWNNDEIISNNTLTETPTKDDQIQNESQSNESTQNKNEESSLETSSRSRRRNW
jgi:hypothetical protein